jgi:microcystin-dependent protein
MPVTLTSTGITFSDATSTTTNLIPSGTVMLFAQTAAPTGWTKSTTHNNKALRVVSGTAGSGGSTAFTAAFGTPTVTGTVGINGAPAKGNLAVSVSGNIAVSNMTLSINQIPSHSHGITSVGPTDGNASGAQHNTFGDLNAINRNTSAAGGGGAHNHGANHNLSGTLNGAPAKGNLAGSLSSATTAINVQYVDVIIATKN